MPSAPRQPDASLRPVPGTDVLAPQHSPLWADVEEDAAASQHIGVAGGTHGRSTAVHEKRVHDPESLPQAVVGELDDQTLPALRIIGGCARTADDSPTR